MKNYLLGVATVIILGPIFNEVVRQTATRLKAEKPKMGKTDAAS